MIKLLKHSIHQVHSYLNEVSCDTCGKSETAITLGVEMDRKPFIESGWKFNKENELALCRQCAKAEDK